MFRPSVVRGSHSLGTLLTRIPGTNIAVLQLLVLLAKRPVFITSKALLDGLKQAAAPEALGYARTEAVHPVQHMAPIWRRQTRPGASRTALRLTEFVLPLGIIWNSSPLLLSTPTR